MIFSNNKIKKIDEKLKSILSAHGITDEKEQMKIIIEIINAFAGK